MEDFMITGYTLEEVIDLSEGETSFGDDFNDDVIKYLEQFKELKKKFETTKKNIYKGLRLCQEKRVKLYVQRCERSFDDEYVIYTDTWETNPNPTISTFVADVCDEDFLIKLEKAIKLFFEHIRTKKEAQCQTTP